jgi:hypothetical protein
MAIQCELSLSSGITLSAAYVIITDISLAYHLSDIPKANITAVIYKDLQSRNDARTEITQFLHTVTGTDFNTYFSETVLKELDKSFMSQAYEYLKSLPTYQNAIDV